MVTNDRLLEILRGYISANSDNVSKPDFNGEKHLLAIMQLAADEATAQAGGMMDTGKGICNESGI